MKTDIVYMTTMRAILYRDHPYRTADRIAARRPTPSITRPPHPSPDLATLAGRVQ
jgi:hypothetical protein